MSNPFAALFEDVEPTTDPILAEVDLEGGAFAPLAPPVPTPAPAPTSSQPTIAPSASAPAPRHAASASPMQSAVHEMLSPPPRLGGSAPDRRRKSIQQALVITWEPGKEPDLLELNDLLASGWRVATTAAFPTADGARGGSLLVVAEQEAPR